MPAAFRPSRHGYSFPNRFPLPMAGVLAPLLRAAGLPATYGLCGGMAALAADDFRAGRALPADEAPPAPGSPLHRRLVRRQFETLGAPTFGEVGRYARWMRMPPCARARRTAAELAAAREAVAEGALVLLGLLFTDRLGRIWENHQVLAYGLGAADALRVYDPNRPGRDAVVLSAAQQSDVQAGGARHLALIEAGHPDRHVLGAFVTEVFPVLEDHVAGGRGDAS